MASSGIVQSVAGVVKAIAVDGTVRILQIGDRVLPNEQIITNEAGTVLIAFSDGSRIDLGRNASVTLNDETLNPEGEINATEQTTEQARQEVASIQKALVDGEEYDPSTLPATAAGAGGTGLGADNEGSSLVEIKYIGPEETPDSGFETTGINASFSEPIEELILEPVLAPAATELLSNQLSDDNETNSGLENTVIEGNVLDNTINTDGPTAASVTGFNVEGTDFLAGATATIPDVGDITILATGGYTFTPETDYNGAVPVINYTVTDGQDTDDSTLTLTVNAVNQLSDDNETNAGLENANIIGNVLDNSLNNDGPDAATVTVFSVTGGATVYSAGDTATITNVGSITLLSTGGYTFTPEANYSGTMPVINYTVTDGLDIDNSTLSLSVTPIADAPTLLLSVGDPMDTSITRTGEVGVVLGDDGDSVIAGENPHDAVIQTLDFGGDFAGQTITLTIDANITGSWNHTGAVTDDVFRIILNGEIVNTAFDPNVGTVLGEFVYGLGGSSNVNLDINETYTFDIVLDSEGKAAIGFDVASTEPIEIVTLTGVSAVIKESVGFEYQLSIDAALADTDGSEFLGPVLIEESSLPISVTEVQDALGNVITASGGFYSVSGTSTFVTLVSSEELSDMQLNTIAGSVTSTETNGGDSATTDATVKIEFDDLDATVETADLLIEGDSANNIIIGGLGDDVIFGNGGDDSLSGGLGADTFVWNSTDTGSDEITDFDAGSDVLNLVDLLSDGSKGIEGVDNGGHLQLKIGVIDTDGHVDTPDQIIDLNSVLAGVNPIDTLNTLLTSGAIDDGL